MKIDPLENIISAKKAAELWGMSESNVKTLAQEGKIYAKKIGTNWVVDKYQQNPKTYTKRDLKSTHYELMQLNVPAFENLNIIKKPKFKIVQEFNHEEGFYTAWIYFSISILWDNNTDDSLYHANGMLFDTLNGEKYDYSRELDDLSRFDNAFIKYIDDEMEKALVRCRDNFIK